ncbi:MAG: hypothetical protein ACYC8W_09165 [Candidatus Tyrphobacter sp.]
MMADSMTSGMSRCRVAAVMCLAVGGSAIADTTTPHIGPPRDMAAVAALAQSYYHRRYQIGTVIVVGTAGYVDFFISPVAGGQIFAKKIAGRWRVVATGGNDAPTPADWSARSHGALTVGQICAVERHIPGMGRPLGCAQW